MNLNNRILHPVHEQLHVTMLMVKYYGLSAVTIFEEETTTEGIRVIIKRW